MPPSHTTMELHIEVVDAHLSEDRSHLLVCVDGSQTVVSLRPNQEVLIGRADTADLVLPKPWVSREHARVVSTQGATQIVDLGSHNGTRVNGERIAGTRELRSGDVISFGSITV